MSDVRRPPSVTTLVTLCVYWIAEQPRAHLVALGGQLTRQRKVRLRLCVLPRKEAHKFFILLKTMFSKACFFMKYKKLRGHG
jgi:hypothetical protein